MAKPELDLIILDDEPEVARVLGLMAEEFYSWGKVRVFTDYLEARTFCFNRGASLGIFLLDVYLGEYSAFDFIEAVRLHYPMAPDDTIVITGLADESIVESCLVAGVGYLLEKPVKPFSLQFAVRTLVSKYVRFAPKLMSDPALARDIQRIITKTNQ